MNKQDLLLSGCITALESTVVELLMANKNHEARIK
ncbi:hypothetical protein A2U01_0111981, partial [Trifolium medium]|nr:hypothetical protein [Trifolium medium]